MNETNGLNGLNESRQKRVEAGILAMAELEQERDNHKRELDELTAQLRGLRAEVDALTIAHARAQGEIEAYRSERDYAVAKRVEVETVFNAVVEIMQRRQKKSFVDEVEPNQT